MGRELRLSERLQSVIEAKDFLATHGLSPEERKEHEQLLSSIEVIVDDIIRSRETIAE